ncbi:hypothetical protein [Sphingomonas sp. TREG-RG-20F-R18-01]|uniref:hypothetical protein n=1 Tax=Sphingomonas sp. TREG-RG-20F-R18-01 TaxID=2914982 RepID=UPI001F5A98B9|nr:hypothetical protein [Sphingomonas sp. TREG-RG-20F-R18-01]
MSILLPSLPGMRAGAKMRLLDWGGTLTPPLGGASQRLDRLGSRHALDVPLPSMKMEPTGRIWLSRLKRAKSLGALYPVPLEGFNPGAPGAPIIAAANQAGTTLQLAGFSANYPFSEGQWFSIIHLGRRYLHSIDADGIAANDGTAVVSITPMLRIIPTVGDVCEFAVPMIEGAIAGNSVEWSLRLEPWVDINFSITEDA